MNRSVGFNSSAIDATMVLNPRLGAPPPRSRAAHRLLVLGCVEHALRLLRSERRIMLTTLRLSKAPACGFMPHPGGPPRFIPDSLVRFMQHLGRKYPDSPAERCHLSRA